MSMSSVSSVSSSSGHAKRSRIGDESDSRTSELLERPCALIYTSPWHSSGFRMFPDAVALHALSYLFFDEIMATQRVCRPMHRLVSLLPSALPSVCFTFSMGRSLFNDRIFAQVLSRIPLGRVHTLDLTRVHVTRVPCFQQQVCLH